MGWGRRAGSRREGGRGTNLVVASERDAPLVVGRVEQVVEPRSNVATVRVKCREQVLGRARSTFAGREESGRVGGFGGERVGEGETERTRASGHIFMGAD